eukprot:TRINITY_DN555_c1_g1_i5.p1 TRINITY_DN555_c1_g1~~TRINITY_DN555_c1_g1_i5.p1  ORF type:complete len:254 (+),score=87.06 TRINITY_DN555_c1_g1_i5:132-893(+)
MTTFARPMGGGGGMFGGVGSKWNMNAVTSNSELTPAVRDHLKKVYVTLTAMVAVATFGAFTYATFGFGHNFSFWGSFGLMLWLLFTPNQPDNLPLRLTLLFGFSFLQGTGLGPLLTAVAEIDPTIPFMAFSGTVVVFACFSASALFAQRRSWLFLGGFLSSAISCMVWMSIFGMFFGVTEAGIMFRVYLGLIVFSLFVIFDTQMIVEKASMGNTDFVRHSLDLFIDFVAIFIRLLIILSKKNGKKKKEESRNR